MPKVEVQEVELLQTGPFKGDRCFALFDSKGEVFSAKRSPLFSEMKMEMLGESIHMSGAESEMQTSLQKLSKEKSKSFFENWISLEFGRSLTLRQDVSLGFPDDPDANGPTILGDKSIERIMSWFGLSFEEVIDRFRPNVIIKTKEPFEEDTLIGLKITSGESSLKVTNICKRCIVPSRNPYKNVTDSDFIKTFMANRQKEKPLHVDEEAYSNFFKVAMNTLTLKGGLIQVGDKLK